MSLVTALARRRGAFAGCRAKAVTLNAGDELSGKLVQGELAQTVAGVVTTEGEDSETASDVSEADN
jgi:hypothetical protein